MPAMISEVYDAFIASGAPEDKARKAAEAIAAYEGRFFRGAICKNRRRPQPPEVDEWCDVGP